MSAGDGDHLIPVFNTQRTRDEDILALSTGRDKEFDRIMGAIARSRKAVPGKVQHVALYGSRGFGKSFMTRRVEIAARALDPAPGPLLYILLPEEMHNLQRSPHAFLTTLAAAVRHQGAQDDAAYQEAMFQWPQKDKDAALWAAAEEELEAAVEQALSGRDSSDDGRDAGRGLVVFVVENFDILLATLFKDKAAEQRLRLWLDRDDGRCMLFATATGTVDMEYDRPLFKAFETVRLSPWSPEDCMAYFERRRAIDGRAPLTASQKAKARAIADFIGGTPRLAALLADVLETEDALTVAEAMDALADRLAEYYRKRIEDLSPLARGLFDALVRGGEPASQTALAERVGADAQSTIARVMQDLQRADIIRGAPAPKTREKLYKVTDRVFAHYYRLRQGSRAAQETPLATILDFLESFYTPDEMRDQMAKAMEARRPADARVFSELMGLELDGGRNHYRKNFADRSRFYLAALSEDDAAAFRTLVELIENDPFAVFDQCCDAPDEPLANAIAAAIRAQAQTRIGDADSAQKILYDAYRRAGDADARLVSLHEYTSFLSNELRDNLAAAEQALLAKQIDASGLHPH